jgi:very-short-patch-repair endonuclease
VIDSSSSSGKLPELDPRLTGRDRVLAQIEVWRKELVNLARSNRLLHYRDTKTSTLGIVREEHELGPIIKRLLAGRPWRFFEPPFDDDDTGSVDPGDLVGEPDELITEKRDSSSLLRTLRTLDRRAVQESMDKGLWILYMAAGMLTWVDPDNEEEAVSPLILIPVTLHRENPREPYRMKREEEEIVLNPALVLKLGEFGIELPALEEPEELDIDDYMASVRSAIAGRRGWKATGRLVISHFSFHKEVMYRDLEMNAEEIADHPIVQALVHGAAEGSEMDFDPLEEDQIDQHGRPENGATVLPADATQRQCITASVGGHSFVMDGPPGTGKSQTIANLIAENMAEGRTVLFVSEKAAALEVVETRMRQVGLGDYTLELHSHKATRKEVAHELARALTHHPRSRAGMPASELSDLARKRNELSARALAVNEVREPLGRSLNSVMGRITQLQAYLQAPHPEEVTESLTAAEFSEVLSVAARLSRAWAPIERGSDFLWRDLDNVTLTSATRQRIDAQVEAAITALNRLHATAADASRELGIDVPNDLAGCQRLLLLLEHLENARRVPSAWLVADDLKPVLELRHARAAQIESRMSLIESLSSAVGDRFRDLPDSKLPSFAASAESLANTQLGTLLRGSRRAAVESMLVALVDTTDFFKELRERTDSLRATFGLPAEEVTFDRARELGELGSLSASTDKPEPEWLSPASLASTEHAAEVLQELVDTFKQQHEELGKTFTDDVLGLDLDSLIVRFDTVHKGFSKLRGTYRADKRTIAEVSRSGRFSAASVALLPQARDWQRLNKKLAEAETRYGSALGEYYYRREDSDFDGLDRAIHVARRALELAGPRPNLDEMKRQLARGGEPTPEVRADADWVVARSADWLSAAEEALSAPFVAELKKEPTSAAIERPSKLVEAVKILLAVQEEVDSVSARALTVHEAHAALDESAQLNQLETELENTFTTDQQQLGLEYKGAETDWAALDDSLEWAATLRSFVGGGVGHEVATKLLSVSIPAAELSQCLNAWLSRRDEICANFQPERREEVKDDLATTVGDARELLRLMGETVADIEVWFDYTEARDKLLSLGAREPIEYCEAHAVEAEEVPLVLERAMLERWAECVIKADKKRIGSVRADQLNNVVDEFRSLDAKVIELASARVINACNERRPRRTELGPAGLLRREGQKQRRHMPVRKLLEEAGTIAQAVKPCFMMTPLTVSQFLPPGLRFDVVIFDEASQVRPSDAINCIYRGDQLLVAGDEQQLPPTSFFEASVSEGDDEYDEDEFAEFESILKLCLGAGGLRQLPLRWHYRSQHEDLILYSNHSFYEGRLISFPGAVHDADDVGVSLYHVPDGVYRRGTSRDNPREASAVVDRMMHWAEWSLTHPDHPVTLGVVAFSEAQASAIEVELDRRREERFDLDPFFQEGRLDGYFIKNLENVQGDERDVMIFSIGYGADENGKFTMNFGPINRAGGKRRLNVAITRARRRVEVVSSVRSERFPSEIAAEGVRHLHRYLDFAARGQAALALDIEDSQLDVESPFEEEVLRVVRSWGYNAVPQVGAAGYRIDIGVTHPTETGRYALGIECDGAMYHSSQVARDRDRLRQEVLEGLGWRLHRIWGTSWYRDRAGQEAKLRDAIESAVQGGVPAPRKRRLPPAPEWTEEVVEVVSADERPDWAELYSVATVTPPSSRTLQMHDPSAQPDLRRMIEEVVVVEGPVSRELVLRRLREAWGVGRTGSRIRVAFDQAVKALRTRGRLVESEKGFLMVDGSDPNRVRLPDGDDLTTRRRIDEVPETELRAAIEYVVLEAMHVGRDELTQAVARLYGWNRRGSEIGPALERAVTYLLRKKRIERDGAYLRLPR